MRSSIAAPLSYFANHLLEFIDVTSPPFFGERTASRKAHRDRVLVVGYGWGTHAFVQTLDQRQYDVHVVSTRPHRLNQPSMIATLQAKYGRKVKADVHVDPELIGGISIRIGDEVHDTSVRGKLAQLADALMK
jgi:hypothetical protein